jgi:predicted Zn-dependent protease
MLGACAFQAPETRGKTAALPPQDSFEGIVARLAPVVRETCLAEDLVRNCNFRLYIADTDDGQANAFQSVDRLGRPYVILTPAFLDDARNADEIAFVLAHEAAHHIRNHLGLQRALSRQGAALMGAVAGAQGLDRAEIREARRVGAFVGARRFSKDFELEADALGALMARKAGYDPLIGARYLRRIPDPGNVALGTHPSNAERLAEVRRALR